MSSEYKENTYIVLGITGVGKSTLIKVLSDDPTIVIGETYKSCTKKCSYHDCNFGSFKYCLIDTPGFEDTEGEAEDEKNFEFIKNILVDKEHKIKGIIIIFNFQDNKFFTYHKIALKKIINLIPIYYFWSYVKIVFSHCYPNSKKKTLEELKENKLKNIKECLKEIVDYANKQKKIQLINLDDLNYHFIDIEYGDKKEEHLSDLIKSLEKNKNFEPLFHSIKVEHYSEQKLLIKNDDAIGDLYNCTYEKTSFLNKYGKLIREEIKLENYYYIKTMEIADLQKDLKRPLDKGYEETGNFIIPSICLQAVGVVTTFFCPPLGIALNLAGAGGGIYGITGPTLGLIGGGIKYVKNIIDTKEILENKYKVCYNLKDKENKDYY